MISVMRMGWFHLRQFARVGYFVGLLVSSTTSMFLLQLLAMRAATGPIPSPDPQLWVRAALVGMWSVCTVSAGMIGFQRMQGTLVHVLFSPRSPIVTLGPIVAAGSCFGILSGVSAGGGPGRRVSPAGRRDQWVWLAALLAGLPVGQRGGGGHVRVYAQRHRVRALAAGSHDCAVGNFRLPTPPACRDGVDDSHQPRDHGIDHTRH